MKTGWPPGLLQDDDRKLSRWLASRPDTRYQLRKNIMDKDTGGPAFPVTGDNYADRYCGEGMTLRDYFAAKPLQGGLASPQEGGDFNERGCEWCYKVADDMLKARGEK